MRLRQPLLWLLFGAGVGALLIAAFQHYSADLQAWILDDPAMYKEKLGIFFGVLTALLTLPNGWFAWSLWRLGRQTRAASTFPPPDVTLLRAMPLLQGRAALRRGRTLQILAWVVAATSLVLCIVLWRLYASLG